jgi:hypothetical protein
MVRGPTFKPYMIIYIKKPYINSNDSIYKHANNIKHEDEIKNYTKIFN